MRSEPRTQDLYFCRLALWRYCRRVCSSDVKELCTTLEHNPTPGACRKIEYIAPRETWEERLTACRTHFAARGVPCLVDRFLLQKAWKSNAVLVDKTMKAHSKCDACALYDSGYSALEGKTSPDACAQREAFKTAKAQHR